MRTLSPHTHFPLQTQHQRDLICGIGAYEELKGNKAYWGDDLNPENIANLFFLRS